MNARKKKQSSQVSTSRHSQHSTTQQTQYIYHHVILVLLVHLSPHTATISIVRRVIDLISFLILAMAEGNSH